MSKMIGNVVSYQNCTLSNETRGDFIHSPDRHNCLGSRWWWEWLSIPERYDASFSVKDTSANLLKSAAVIGN
jgi:hypothetical protein